MIIMSYIKFDGKGVDMAAEELEKLKSLFPQCIVEGKLDWEKLRALCGEYIDDGPERFRLEWNGKRDCHKLVNTPTWGTLLPCKAESVDWETTKNIYIEGENFEVLKILQKSYQGKIKMIFIDPPYNTGEDYIYDDSFVDPLQGYLEQTQQTTQSNPEKSGRYHTKWLNMMYPRLLLARNLLREDGSIFVSVDFNEFANLKRIMDDVFGSENFQREIIWRIGWLSGFKTKAANFIRNHDIILFYSKDASKLDFIKQYIERKDFKPVIKEDDTKLSEFLESLGLDDDRKKQLFDFVNRQNRPERYPIEDTWNCNEYDDLNSIAIVSFSGEKVSKILGIDQEFKGQKSTKLMERLISSTTRKDDIILDFFSGSASTAHAVMKRNKTDNSNRRYIMVQLPELCGNDSAAGKAGYANICEIGKERLRRVGDKLRSNDKELLRDHDVGFRVFKMASSNFKKWDEPNTSKTDEKKLLDLMEGRLYSQKEGRSEEDIVYELMIKQGVELTENIEVLEVNNHKVYYVAQMFICLDGSRGGMGVDDFRKMVELRECAKVIMDQEALRDDSTLCNIDALISNGQISEIHLEIL